ncbi:hypothetical protein ABE321_07180 [Bacillus paralicheniformis]|uniref:hypothetical protein n=1 Tax=Bacillus paralicheniformis TaxID=1648923 RepID=UPI0011A1624F|nr:hypothetical protein [Bacillus paralicheniformis]MCU4666573.1 hypothetical protein [Bacillus paralicheniformis]MEC1823518.1 hypothetical protein [Bacillus paralicheniformis]TWJ39829.1 hypothetical protein CHCC5027_1410 [Bacillus paralicheniformis]TWK24865.1 hypothetical protein CHCC20372_2393 [Bacillus paralicheniformis]
MKKSCSSIAILLTFVLGLASLAVPSSSAASQKIKITAKSTLESYLDAVKDQNVKKMMENVIDERGFSTEEYKDIMSYEKLKSYEIVKSKSVNPDKQYYVVKGTYDGGLVKETPVEVKKVDSKWKVNINNETLTSEDNKTLEHGDDNYNKKTVPPKKQLGQVIKPADVLIWWDYYGRRWDRTFYSSSAFSVPNTSTLKLAIVSQHSTLNGTGMTYAVVKKGLFGDTVWGSRYIGGDFANRTYTVTGSPKTLKGVNLRFTPNSKGGYYTGKGAVDW